MQTEPNETEIYYIDADITLDLLNLFLFTLSIITFASWMDSAVWCRKVNFFSTLAYSHTELKWSRFDFEVLVKRNRGGERNLYKKSSGFTLFARANTNHMFACLFAYFTRLITDSASNLRQKSIRCATMDGENFQKSGLLC